jgi:low temperature requirement protein LtrA
VAGLYAGIQIARPLFAIVVLRGDVLRMVFVRVLPWSTATAALVLLGATQEGTARALLWAASVAIDLFGAAIGFHVPGLGHSQTTEWEIDGGHFAERCQAFVLIALGESLVVSGSTIAAQAHPSGTVIVAFVAAFVACAGLWWIYFDRAAEDSARLLRESSDPGRLGRDAFHWVHPVIVAGIIVTAAADDLVLADPGAHLSGAPAWLIPGGVALFLGGHALFKAVMWRLVSWPRVIGVAVLVGLGLLAPHVAALTLGGCSLAVIISVAVADRIMHPVVA